MDNKKGVSFFLIIILIIVGSKLYKHFDFENLKFEKPALDTVYLITLLVLIFVLVKAFITRPKK